MQKRKHAGSSRKRYIIFAAILLLLCASVVFLSFQYYNNLQRTMKAESGDYLQEISEQIGASAGKTIEDNFTILGTISTVLKNTPEKTVDKFCEVIRDQEQHWNFNQVLLVDEEGIAYDAAAHMVVLASEPYLREAVVERKRSMSTSQMINGNESIVFAIPAEGLTMSGKRVSAIIATYDLATFDQILSIGAFDGKGYGHIIRRDGAVVIRSSSPAASVSGYNILKSMATAPFAKGSAEGVLSDISEGRSGQAELTLEGQPLCMVYTPLETQEWYLLTFVPSSVATAKSSLFLSSTMLIGAFIALLFLCLLIAFALAAYRHKRKLEQIAYVDPVTGGSTIARFYIDAIEKIESGNDCRYALAYTNIGKFKVLNEQLGRTTCDTILMTTANGILLDLDKDECMGRQFADNFCVLIKYENEQALAKRFERWSENYNQLLSKSGVAWLPLTVEIGVYILSDASLPVQDMIDRAKLALRETPHRLDSLVRYSIYDEQVRRKILRDKQLEDLMADALANHEFIVYLQPKYNTKTEQINGAEALVRWNSSVLGLIYPDEFISLFEKNGFVVRLDLWVFEQVCKKLRGWLQAGEQPVRISVNCSRVHIKMPGFLEKYREIAERYGILPSLLEIELTENVVFEDVESLTKIIEDIHEVGFICSMDDFGSGYSSLNLIGDIPVDVLKLDRVFFRSDKADPTRTESVVGCVINMAQALKMETVAEGVEERSQVDMLKRLGCDLIQGYYYAKPMPMADFEKLTFGREITEE